MGSAALKNQQVAAKVRTVEQEQESRRRSAAYCTTVERDGVEIEVAVGGGSYRAEPDVGVMQGGYEVEGAVRIDTGEPIELTRAEEESIAIEAAESEHDRREQAMCDAAEAREDWS